ncbi:3-deoxy-manno-octulosonate cytidylyltransferase [bacterium]|nr:3-deoxy-manno-octulosonate cytidylyltransferase [bacterium]
MEKVFCIIPARYGSTRAQGKLLRKILDKPLIQWVWLNASKISSFSDVFIATDSEEIENSIKKFGGKIIRTSSSHKCGTDRIAEAARILNLADEDIIVNIQADEPLISSLSVESLVSSLRKSGIIDMATLAYQSSSIKEFQNSNTVKVVVDNNNFALYFSRSQIPFYNGEKQDDFVFLKHLGIYAYKMDFLQKIATLPVSLLEEKEKLEQLRALDNDYKIKVVNSLFDSQSVNAEEDFKMVENLLQMQIRK